MNTQKTILIVEDEKKLREVLVDALHFKNFHSLEAENGREGVEIALSKHPDLILLDVIMPEMDGMTALKKIREDAWGLNAPVIILTNLSANKERIIEDMVEHRPLCYLMKSDWKILDVVKKIEDVLKT